MFEADTIQRFTQNARLAIIRAQEAARDLGHRWLGREHLLLGVILQDGTPATLARFGITAESCRAAIVTVVGDGEGLSAEDAKSLRAQGVYVPGPPAPAEEPRRGLRFFGRRKKSEPHPGPSAEPQQFLPFTPSGGRALHEAGHVRVPGQRDSRVTPHHLLAGVLDPEDEVMTRIFRELGVDVAVGRAETLAELSG